MSLARLTDNAELVLRARYLRRAPDGEVTETPGQMFGRVARHVSGAELVFGPAKDAAAWEERFLEAMLALDFLPNSPTLMNAGSRGCQLAACYVLPVGDSIDSIFKTLHDAALIHQSGGGTGFDLTPIRPRGDVVEGVPGVASGVLSFLRVFDSATQEMRQGGRRRGANMGVLAAEHPEIQAFVKAKLASGAFRNFNLSVRVPDNFFRRLARGESWALTHAHREQEDLVPAPELFHAIAEAAWSSGEPGLLFADAIERANPTPALGKILATNPCGEVPLLPYENCTLGSINLAHCLRGHGPSARFDFDRLRELASLGVRFLDDVVEVNRFPITATAKAAHATRKIGLGVMGLAETLIRLGIPYDDPGSVRFASDVARALREAATEASARLAAARGAYPAWNASIDSAKGEPRRNATVLSIAPTGTISTIAGTTPSIEPLFGVAYTRRHILGESSLVEASPLFSETMEARGFDIDRLIPEIARTGSVQGLRGVPEDVQRIFRSALDVPPEAHLAIQAAFQAQVDNAVSKTVNLPSTATIDDVKAIFRSAHEQGLKGVTVYRYGSRAESAIAAGVQSETFDLSRLNNCETGACRL
jgi:ribonucleoside-diphosphate reductase alpha chain